MALVNQIQISGYVATEPQVLGKDRNAGRFRIRWDRGRKIDGEWKNEPNFFSVVLFGGEMVERMLELKKGNKVLVSGRMQQQERETETGKREYVDIIATEFAFIPTDDGTQLRKTPSESDGFLN